VRVINRSDTIKTETDRKPQILFF